MKKRESRFVYSDAFTRYHFHDDHPFNQQRVQLTYSLMRALDIIADEQLLAPRRATDDELALVHNRSYIDLIKKCSGNDYAEDDLAEAGLDTEDTPVFPGVHEATARIVGGTLAAIDEVVSGDSSHALNLAGGLHHAMSGKASGFCIYNDASVGIAYLQQRFPDMRVLYIDTDAHHGDGVQWSFYDDPLVCTFSIHETGRYLFPGTGDVTERGAGKGYGLKINVPLDAFTEDDSYLVTLEAVLPKLVAGFRPDFIISQHGCDAHRYDPLTHLAASMRIYREIPRLVHELAHAYCDGRWVALGGGGYDRWRVVPRAWTLLWAEMNDRHVGNVALPEAWVNEWQPKSPVKLPPSMFDPVELWQPIPRRAEITEKNERTVARVLSFLP
ncbi:acetoin utilization protein AcuC [Numidum massiliense]|uniref:acetoin utilization protein AcuC n=1 Tax=Numidum massiliense TaxID=1522315 RepID=UPI0006D53369|nr:acetoin utilization protein AcuC [Numidum massiliense]